MSFNPYYKWLGIPEKDQPPTHYRLLGIELFESDPDVIDTAANRQMAYLQECANGEHAAMAEELLNQVSAARICLLKPAMKAAYDRTLQSNPATSMSSKTTPQQTAHSTPVVNTDSRPRRRKNSPQPSVAFELLKVVVVSGVFVCGAFWFLNQDRTDPQPTTASTGPGAVAAPVAPKPITPEVNSSFAVEQQPANASTSEIVDVPTLETPPPEDEPSDESVTPELKATQENAGNRSLADLVNPPKGIVPSPTDPLVSDSRRAVPTESEIASATARVKDLFFRDFSEASTPQQKIQLARKMADIAKDTEQPASRFVLLRSANNIAIGAGDVGQAMYFTDLLASDFNVDAISESTDTLRKLTRHLSTSDQKRAFGKAALSVVDEMIKQDDYDHSEGLLELGRSAALSGRDMELAKAIAAKQESVAVYSNEFELIRPAFEKLQTNPTDSKAAGEVGQFYCLVKGFWSKGLPLLTRSNLNALREVANLELEPPGTTQQMVHLADQWWEIADKQKDDFAADQLRQHAQSWYSQSLPKLSGLEQVRVEKRMERVGYPDSEEQHQSKAQVGDVVAVLIHKSEKGAGAPVTLHRSGRLSIPLSNKRWESQTWWTMQHNMVVMIYPSVDSPTGYWIDVAMLDDSGTSYTGSNQDGVLFDGRVDETSGDWNQLRDSGPFADKDPSTLVVHIEYKQPKFKKPFQKRLLAGGFVNELDNAARWVILNRFIIMVFPSKKFWVDSLKVFPDGTLVGGNQEGTKFKGRVIESTPLFTELIGK